MNRSIYTAFAASVLFPLHERLKGHSSVAARAQLESSQWWPRHKLLEWQRDRLQRLLQHARAHVPYYRELFHRHRLEVEAIKDVAHLSRLPFLTKQEIRANFDALKSEQAGKLTQSNTGGSSGEPLVFLLGAERVSHDVAAKWRATRWWDVDIGDREIVVWGSPIELGAQDYVRQLRDRLMRTKLLPAFDMSERSLDHFVAQIERSRPRVLFGYPSSLSLIARHAQRRGRALHNLGIRVAFVTSEKLYDDQRESIARVFGCRVANGYGGRDAGFIAHECPAGSMHITAEDIVVETVNAAGAATAPGEAGEIVVTHLASRDFPFVRYRTGDVGLLSDEPCACGRSLPILKEIQGRSTDFVVAADGTVMHGLALIYVLRSIPGIRAFKIVQESLRQTKVLLVRGDGLAADAVDKIKAGLRARLGAEVAVDVDEVEEIAAERSGKFRYVVSKVAV